MRHARRMSVGGPHRLPSAPPELGRLGTALAWLAGAQGGWPPHAPHHRRGVDVRTGGLSAGVEQADALVDAGVDLVTIEGPPATRPAYVSFCVLLDIEPVTAIGTSARPGWAELVVQVRDALPAARTLVSDPARLADDGAFGHACGLLGQLAQRRTPVLIGSSPLLAAAALLADRITPDARRWWLVASPGLDVASRQAYAELELEPLLDLGLTVPGGAALAAELLVGGIDLATRLHEQRADRVEEM
jgi:nicotinate-nucleotide--dimethylbenzimidazole phosphoribosyltransferase